MIEAKANKLSNVDYKIELHTDDGSIYSPKSWEVIGKTKSALKLVGKIKGTKLRVKHLVDGMLRENKGKEIYQVSVFHENKWHVIPTIQKK
jgi:hypothetical protein